MDLYQIIYFILWIGISLDTSLGLPQLIRIGGLFGYGEDPSIESAFRYAIYKINHDRNLLPDTKIAYDIQHLPTFNSFKAAKKACKQVNLGVASIFGPQSENLAGHINSICNFLEIPHVETRLDTRADVATSYSFNLYPDSSVLSRAYLDIIKYFKWRKIFIIYGDQTSLLLLQDILKAPVNNDVTITVRQASKLNMREVLKEAQKKKFSHIIADLNIDDTHLLMKAALQIGMIDSNYHFVLTNLDIETLDLDDYKYNFVNLTGLRLVTRDDPDSRIILDEMAEYQRRHGVALLNKTDLIKTEAALMYDAVNTFAHALEGADKSAKMRLVNLSCEENEAWSDGSTLYNYLNLVNKPKINEVSNEYRGLTGPLEVSQGVRTDFNLDILQLTSNGIEKVGYWNPQEGINFTVSYDAVETRFGNRTLIITSIKERPYVMEKKPGDKKFVGNDRYEGFCVDLLAEIAKIVKFTYKIELVPDDTYGAPNDKGEWNGMVRQLIDKKADLAVASLTINYIREQVIDFTKPFMNLGISILFKVPKREKPGLFSFLNPLAIDIWLYVVAAYFVVSFLMFILARFSPYEWYNPHPCNPDTDIVLNNFSLGNTFWFAVGTLMQQGSDINPRAVSTRIIGGMWWFFTLIIISSYTANLAAFLTVERMVSPIENAEDLSKQTKISYGTISGGSTMTFFRESEIPTYQRMWSFMSSKKPTVFASSTEEGIRRVKQGNYAFLMESTMLDYTIQRNCDLMPVGGLLDSKGYGIGTPTGSLWRDPISLAILSLQENGKIAMLYNKWWRNTGTCSRDEKSKDSTKAHSLGVANVGGVFVVLVAGLSMAILVSCVEFLYNAKRNATKEKTHSCAGSSHFHKQSLCTELAAELRFAVRCHGSSKRPALKRQCSRCVSHTAEPPNPINGVRSAREVQRRHSHLHVPPHSPHDSENGNGYYNYPEYIDGGNHMQYKETKT
ncbi:unnamed protein product [Owenia fusiformis]|uniref:Glutamate receptor ionotropic, kainate 2 n=1 Tax=Owenia fusiformis TaxID=6347 RepID=A0A8S4Q304_OWEFU|nr:unnamed protein product [Owenia fusiformis]